MKFYNIYGDIMKITNKIIISILEGWNEGNSWLMRDTEETVEEIAQKSIVPDYEYDPYVNEREKYALIDISLFKEGWLLAFFNYWWQLTSQPENISTIKRFRDPITNELLTTETAINIYIHNAENQKIFEEWRKKH